MTTLSSRWALASLFGLLLVTGGISAVGPKAWSAPSEAGQTSADALLAAAKAAGPKDHPIVLLHDQFPDEWQSFSTALSRKRPPTVTADAYASTFLADLIERRWVHFETAPATSLKALAKAEVGLLKALRANSTQSCADYGDDGILPKAAWSNELAQAHEGYLSKALSAISGGMETRTNHARLTPVDIGPVAIGFANRGGTIPQWDAMVSADTSDLSTDSRCLAWTAFFGAMEDAPAESAGRFLSIRYRALKLNREEKGV